MVKTMERQALGLIECVGLIGAIEAADAAAKAAAVRIVKTERTDPALITIHIEGELGAVQAAVDAGVAAGNKIGKVLTSVVIPRPDEGLGVILETPSNIVAKPTTPRSNRSPSQSRPVPGRQPARPTSELPDSGSTTGYASMTVVALRRLARRRGDLPISGREIARADKVLLLRLLLEADRRRGQ